MPSVSLITTVAFSGLDSSSISDCSTSMCTTRIRNGLRGLYRACSLRRLSLWFSPPLQCQQHQRNESRSSTQQKAASTSSSSSNGSSLCGLVVYHSYSSTVWRSDSKKIRLECQGGGVPAKRIMHCTRTVSLIKFSTVKYSRRFFALPLKCILTEWSLFFPL